MPYQPVEDRELSYPEVGATQGTLPDGYETFTQRRVLGSGEQLFRSAADKLLGWQMHRAAGIHVADSVPRAVPGLSVALRLGPGCVSVEAGCRVVYVIDEPRRQGFAYGTLHGHPERGEERFSVQWNADDTVEFAITAFSVPALWWSRAAAPVSRRIQRLVTRRYLNALVAAPS